MSGMRGWSQTTVCVFAFVSCAVCKYIKFAFMIIPQWVLWKTSRLQSDFLCVFHGSFNMKLFPLRLLCRSTTRWFYQVSKEAIRLTILLSRGNIERALQWLYGCFHMSCLCGKYVLTDLLPSLSICLLSKQDSVVTFCAQLHGVWPADLFTVSLIRPGCLLFRKQVRVKTALDLFNKETPLIRTQQQRLPYRPLRNTVKLCTPPHVTW